MSSGISVPKAYVVRREGFSSAHRMYNNKWDEETNKRVFGQCYQLHGHNYRLEVSLFVPVSLDHALCYRVRFLMEADALPSFYTQLKEI